MTYIVCIEAVYMSYSMPMSYVEEYSHIHIV